MKVSRIIVKSSCKICSGSVSFKLDRPLSRDILSLLVNTGFTEREHFTKAGLLYVENSGIIATGRFGSDLIQTKCKTKTCDIFINGFEELLLQMG